MVISWWRRRRRNKLVAGPFPDEWTRIIQDNVALSHRLNPAERDKLCACTQIFVAEKYWEGCNGLEITEEIKVTIASQACLLVLGFPAEYFNQLSTVLVYPGQYYATSKTHGPGGVITETTLPRLGETWQRGPVILSWPSVLDGCRAPDDGENVVLHEFAHYFDMLGQTADGIPPAGDDTQYQTWQDVLAVEYARLVDDTDRGDDTLLNPYGATSQVEFFAVATEHFFEQPLEMQQEHPRLYRVLWQFYRQDPAARHN